MFALQFTLKHVSNISRPHLRHLDIENSIDKIHYLYATKTLIASELSSDKKSSFQMTLQRIALVKENNRGIWEEEFGQNWPFRD